jgi:hypothetical protein
MHRILAAALVLALPQLAWAQGASYCAGAVTAVQFATVLTTGTATRANYRVELENTQGSDRRLQITILASFVDRPTAPVVLRSRTRQWVNLGHQTVLAPGQALRGPALENVLRISCV